MLNVRLLGSGQVFPIDYVRFFQDNHNNYFLLKSSTNENVNITVPYLLKVKLDYTKDKFTCLPFLSPCFFKEDNIFEVHVTDNNLGRIGWVFPVQSLVSDQHSKAENNHFLKYAFVTAYKLITGEYFEQDVIVDVADFNCELQLTDIYRYDTLILSLSNQQTEKIEAFNIENYLPSFYVNKYFICNFPTEIEELQLYQNASEPSKIRINKISDDLKNEVFINALFKSHLKSKNHPFVQFSLLYQIIELLINRIYDCEIKKIISTVKLGGKTPPEIGIDIKNITAEESRIKKLFNEYSSEKNIQDNNLIFECNQLLSYFGKQSTTFHDAFYSVRNTLIHNYRKFTEIVGHIEILKQLNSTFEILLAQTLSRYKEPENLIAKVDEQPLAWLMYQLLNDAKLPE